jgi:hypothetical protein
MLERAGPRPLGEMARRRWADCVVSCALERELGIRQLGIRELGRREPAVRDPAVLALGVRDVERSPAVAGWSGRPASAQVPGI